MAKPSSESVDQAPRGEGKTEGKDAELLALGARIKRFREQAGLTQEALADAADLHWTYIGQIERGERNLTYKNVLKLARGLGVEAARLMPD
jgi:transcriptional regulator with XRE-family HTH domain